MKGRLTVLVLFGIAFAFVEAAVVFYLRQLLGYGAVYPQVHEQDIINLGFIAFIKPSAPILGESTLDKVETAREFATIIMLVTVAYLSGKTLKQKLGAFLIAFATWDIFYYVFLKLLANWPQSLFDIDIFFLIPIPWVGPVITAIIISTLLFIIGFKLFTSKTPPQIKPVV